MWRRSRRPSGKCVGVDLNRNFDIHFGESSATQTSCVDNYCGLEAFSEPESLALSQFIRNFTNIKLYLSFHAYGQYLLLPTVSCNQFRLISDGLLMLSFRDSRVKEFQITMTW